VAHLLSVTKIYRYQNHYACEPIGKALFNRLEYSLLGDLEASWFFLFFADIVKLALRFVADDADRTLWFHL
jgi:hypothetical protein